MPTAHKAKPSGPPLDTKFVGVISGRFILSDRPVPAGADPVNTCRTQSVTPTELAVAATVTAKPGERFVALFDRLGSINGKVARTHEDGFVVAIAASPAERKSIAATLAWLKRRRANLTTDHRASPRIKTRGEAVKVEFDGQTVECQLRDISVSGASFTAATVPPLKAEIHIGAITGRVVRHAENGFGIRFATEQTMASLLKDMMGA